MSSGSQGHTWQKQGSNRRSLRAPPPAPIDKMLIQHTCCCPICQAQQQVLGTQHKRDRAGYSEYTDLEKIIYAQVFYPHAAWDGKRVKFPSQRRRGKKSEAPERVRVKSSGCFLIVVGGRQFSDFGQDPSIWVISAGRCGREIWTGPGEEPKWVETVILASPRYLHTPSGTPSWVRGRNAEDDKGVFQGGRGTG